MRTTINLDDDVLVAIAQRREESRLGLSEAVNQLIRLGLAALVDRPPFTQRTSRIGLRVDVSNVGEALELLEALVPR